MTAGSPPLSPKCSSVLSRLTTKSESEEKKSSASNVESRRSAITKAITVIAIVISSTATLYLTIDPTMYSATRAGGGD